MECYGYKLNIKALDEQGKFEGYATGTGNEDENKDVILPGAVEDTAGQLFPFMWMHDPRSVLGIIRALGEEERGLAVKGEFNLETEAGREKYSLTKQGALKGLSIGYKVLQEQVKAGIRYLKKIRIYEVSLTPIGFNTNPLAVITDLKAIVPFQDLPLDEAIIAFGAYAMDKGMELKKMQALLETLSPANAELKAADIIRDVQTFRKEFTRCKS